MNILLLTAVLLTLLVAWGMRFYNEDLFVALCAGREIVQGTWAEPDTWSFTTGGEVWIDQGWLSHLLFYFSYAALTHWGPVLLKGMLLGLCLIVLYVRSSRLGVSASVTLFALSFGMLATAPFAQIRAENFGVLYFLVLTAFLTAPPSRGRLRYLGTFLLFVLWTNSHGSFILAFVFVGIKAGTSLMRAVMHLPSLRTVREHIAVGSERDDPESAVQSDASPCWSEFVGWGLTLIACISAASMLNPYGIDNLLMPLRQLSAEAMTGRSEDWIPLVDRYEIVTRAWFTPQDVKPFLVLVCAMLIATCVAVIVTGPRKALAWALSTLERDDRPDVLMEAIVTVVMVAMCFRFRRFIYFGGLAAVPALALLAGFWVERIRQVPASHRSVPGRRSSPRLGLLLAVLWSAGTCWIFLRTTVVPYLPDNPFRPNRPLVRQLMSFDNSATNLVRFLRKAGIEGRVFAGWTTADYVLFHVPDVKVFFDCRDQSAYSDEIIGTFFEVLQARIGRPQRLRRALEILDRYAVATVILKTTSIETPPALALLRSRQWTCVYKDPHFYVLMPASSGASPNGETARRLSASYPSGRIEVESIATRLYFLTGRVPRALQVSLIEFLHQAPDPDLYRLVAWAKTDSNGCLNETGKFFLNQQLARLSRTSPLYADGANEVLNSIVRIAHILRTDEKRCGITEKFALYGRLMRQAEQRTARLRSEYLGF